VEITFEFYKNLKEQGGVKIHFTSEHIVHSDIIDLQEHSNLYGIERTPFSVTFFVEEKLVHPQQIYTLETKNNQFFEVFLVPLGPVNGGTRYEAVYA
jgi:hypothetical protein